MQQAVQQWSHNPAHCQKLASTKHCKHVPVLNGLQNGLRYKHSQLTVGAIQSLQMHVCGKIYVCVERVTAWVIGMLTLRR